ncbi:MAG: hypothetical protein IKE60_02495 [Reyranella sp.]|uniref:hypothetical protein n=1 Tax=Reyranella sp. TaxID=1929291 RepID=UPI0025DEBF9C|nr:hypothetical protein [Reyranella sp.]MBR2813492.1 hypothetical protein [Reyranella sp.]
MPLPTFLTTPLAKGIAVSLVALILIGGTVWVLRSEFSKGQKAGAAGVSSAVQTETIRKVDDSRKAKEKADEEVRRTPYDDRVDGLR